MSVPFRERNPVPIGAISIVTLIALLALRGDRARKLLFDMRGFWADERIDGNLWDRRRKLYRQNGARGGWMSRMTAARRRLRTSGRGESGAQGSRR